MKLIKSESGASTKLTPFKEGFTKMGDSMRKNMKRNLIVMGSVPSGTLSSAFKIVT